MCSAISRIDPLAGRAWRSAVPGALAVRPAAPCARWSVRAAENSLSTLEEALALRLPRRPHTSSQSADRSALWLGPDEWLVLVESSAADRWRAYEYGRLLAGEAVTSIVEVSNRSVAVELEGDKAAWVLNAGCPLDLHPEAFVAGSCSRTLFAKAEVVVWRPAGTRSLFRVEFWRSYSEYLWALLTETAAEICSGTCHPVDASTETGAAT